MLQSAASQFSPAAAFPLTVGALRWRHPAVKVHNRVWIGITVVSALANIGFVYMILFGLEHADKSDR